MWNRNHKKHPYWRKPNYKAFSFYGYFESCNNEYRALVEWDHYSTDAQLPWMDLDFEEVYGIALDRYRNEDDEELMLQFFIEERKKKNAETTTGEG